MWVIGSLVLVVLAATVLVATVIEPEPVDRAVAVPDVVGPDDLRAALLPMRLRGYDPGSVDALLARAADVMAALGEELEDGGGDGAGVLDGGPVADVGEDGDTADGD